MVARLSQFELAMEARKRENADSGKIDEEVNRNLSITSDQQNSTDQEGTDKEPSNKRRKTSTENSNEQQAEIEPESNVVAEVAIAGLCHIHSVELAQFFLSFKSKFKDFSQMFVIFLHRKHATIA